MGMDIRRRVGLNLRKYRQDAGFSQEGLALECGLHRTYVSSVEHAVRNPTVTVLKKFAGPLSACQVNWRSRLRHVTSYT